jgi:putative flippase GtrA
MIQKALHFKVVRYLISGGASFVTDYAVLAYSLEVINLGTGVSASMGMISGILISFTLNKMWTFSNLSNENIRRQFMQYLGLVIFNYLFTVGFLVVLDNMISPLVLKPITVGLITSWNYILYKRVIFS